MVAKKSEKETAIELRKRGLSYSEICERLGIAKGSCSLWLRAVPLSAAAKKRLCGLQEKAREEGRLVAKRNRSIRDERIRKKTKHGVDRIRLSKTVIRLLCAFLYWAEGEKHSVTAAFSNSDPKMVRTYLMLLRSGFDIKEDKFRAQIHLHEYHNKKQMVKYWSRITGIPMARITVYNKPNSGKNIREGYPGCVSVRYHDVRLAREIEFLYNAFIEKLGGVG